MDDKDRLLLSLLRRDARRSLVALARDLGLSRSATQERLAKLQDSGVITGFTVVEGAAERRSTAHLLIRLAPGRHCAQLVPRVKTIPAVVQIHSVAGAIDLIVRVEGDGVAPLEQARAAIAAIDGIAEVSTFIVLDHHLG
ncbi:Lrp/AsnC family transcriptional regulator [Azospirillum griseum]|uniref:Lrp/AsnC family transcriptional regulator n=1 Tax=Azospirillum griseum TaxID=2496639 RepID=A0A431VNV6_9PROT|nr:Lrp/AsnC family transcriptional regulator [Azospirillum griseum]RTR24452.1 Lrp/AsnC family transcriptional regulator [Azospirillum griseum]